MFTSAAVAGIADMPLTIPRLVGSEMSERPITAAGHWANVPMSGIETVINMTIESTATMEPSAGTKKHSAIEPVRAIVAVG
jgi:hypothetical protein